MKKLRKMLCGILAAVTFATASAAAAPYDIQRHWVGSAANTLLVNGIMNTYSDGKFRPDGYVTREDLVSDLYRLMKRVHNPEAAPNGINYFWDVDPNSASAEAINYLASQNALYGYADGSFRPKNVITREEYAGIIYEYTKRFCPVSIAPYVNFSDIDWSFARDAIRILCSVGYCYGFEDGTFRPYNALTRAEEAAMLYGLSGLSIVPIVCELPNYNVINVPYISQLSPVYAVVGCEATSLLMGMHAKGYATNIDLRTFLDNMPKHSSNPAKGFVGSPYKADKTKKTRTTIYPAPLTAYASRYGRVLDFSGSSPLSIQAEVLHGNPVVIYATMRWETPYYREYSIEGETQTLLSNNHAVLICGYNANTNEYYIADPYNVNDTSKEYRYWISGSVLEPIYNVRRQALVVE